MVFYSERLVKLLLHIDRYLNFACLVVYLYPINVKTVELIGPKLVVASFITPGKVYDWLKLKHFD